MMYKPTPEERDHAIRIGAAEFDKTDGQALAGYHLLLNRMFDPRWPNSLTGVIHQPKQFSALNKGAGGNRRFWSTKAGSKNYQRMGAIFDQVVSQYNAGKRQPWTHFWERPGMEKLVAEGHQKNLVPPWLSQTAKESGGEVVVDGLRFSGRAAGTDTPSGPTVAPPTREARDGAVTPPATIAPKKKVKAGIDALTKILLQDEYAPPPSIPLNARPPQNTVSQRPKMPETEYLYGPR